MRLLRKIGLPLGFVALLGACGDTVGEQAIIGTAAGAGTAAVVGGSIITGAAVGAAGNIAFCQLYPSRC